MIAFEIDAAAVGRKHGRDCGRIAGTMLAQGELALNRANQKIDRGLGLTSTGSHEHRTISIRREAGEKAGGSDEPLRAVFERHLADLVLRARAGCSVCLAQKEQRFSARRPDRIPNFPGSQMHRFG